MATPGAAQSRRWIYRSCLALAIGLLLFGAAELISWRAERARLRTVAEAVAGPARDEGERLTRLTSWIYQNGECKRNRRYHLWRKLGATPVSVLEHGGNCQDKTKLMVALLRELDVESSLAMLYQCRGCKPRHTVVFVEMRDGWTIADPAFDITFPDGRGGFHTIEELRADRTLLERRLAELRAERGPIDPINDYKRDIDHHALMTTVNWDKNALTRGAAALIRAAGAEPWSTPRPFLLDDPKLFFTLFGLGGALGFTLLALLLRPSRPQRAGQVVKDLLRDRGGRVGASAISNRSPSK
jgi:hypothetical protein